MLLFGAIFLYFADREILDFTRMSQLGISGIFLWIFWLCMAAAMFLRIFPNKKIAIGARKHFSCSYKPRINEGELNDSYDRYKMHKFLNRGVLFVAISWLTVSIVLFFSLHRFGILTPASVLIVALLYSVLDLAFILFFCPFQALFMRNRCCTLCRIYNWDFAMICTVLILFPSFYSISLFLLSIAVLFRWEFSLWKNPHFFTKETNENLQCSLCSDGLCKIVKGRLAKY